MKQDCLTLPSWTVLDKNECVSNGNINILESEHVTWVSQVKNFYLPDIGANGKSEFGFESFGRSIAQYQLAIIQGLLTLTVPFNACPSVAVTG